MALFKFTQHILTGKPVPVFNHGIMMRDFTYIDDIVEGIIRTMDKAPKSSEYQAQISPATSTAPYQIYNIGNQKPVELKKYISVLEHCLNKQAHLEMIPMQMGDVQNTYADVK